MNLVLTIFFPSRRHYFSLVHIRSFVPSLHRSVTFLCYFCICLLASSYFVWHISVLYFTLVQLRWGKSRSPPHPDERMVRAKGEGKQVSERLKGAERELSSALQRLRNAEHRARMADTGADAAKKRAGVGAEKVEMGGGASSYFACRSGSTSCCCCCCSAK